MRGNGGKMAAGAVFVLVAATLVWGTVHFMNSPKPEGKNKTAPNSTQGVSPTSTASKPTTAGGPLSDALKKPDTTLPDAPKPGPVDVTKVPGSPPPATHTATNTTPTNTTPTTGTNTASPANTETPSLPPSASSSAVRSLVEAGDRAQASGKLVEARASFSRALLSPDLPKSEQSGLREKLATINAELLFSPKIVTGDPMVEQYTVASGDALEKISRRRALATRWELIQRVNGITNPAGLKIGQKLKLVRGPFHAMVTKSDYRLDLFWGSPDEPESWLYIRSFRVGLGEGNGTPTGTFTIKNRQKNPSWTNPRTGEKFAADDPKNPVGEYWLGWQGQGASSVHTGFGLHGTIDPASIGQQKSLGCVRMGDADIAMMWEFLTEEVSIVRVQN
jgi:LysM repeat protein